MKLYDIIKGVAKTSLPDMEISDVTSDTRKAVKAGSMFVCIKGKTFDGHDAAMDMIEKGCSVVVCERDLGLDCQIIVENTREAFPLLCAAFFGHPEKELTLIGVTGTNGKTTITTVIKKVLSSFGCKVGLIGTCQNEIGDDVYPLQERLLSLMTFMSFSEKWLTRSATMLLWKLPHRAWSRKDFQAVIIR